MKKTYSEKLKDPRWQRKRLEILKEHDFTCEDCGSKTETLHVHHGFYEKGKEPWEYPDTTLHCLCESCHSRRQEGEALIMRGIAHLPTRTLVGVWNFCVCPLFSDFCTRKEANESSDKKS